MRGKGDCHPVGGGDVVLSQVQFDNNNKILFAVTTISLTTILYMLSIIQHLYIKLMGGHIKNQSIVILSQEAICTLICKHKI